MQDVKWLQTITSLPILVKGVVTAEDSKCSVQISLLRCSSTLTSAIVIPCNNTNMYAMQLDLQSNMVLLESSCPITAHAS